jgi:hypothetical protein
LNIAMPTQTMIISRQEPVLPKPPSYALNERDTIMDDGHVIHRETPDPDIQPRPGGRYLESRHAG